MDYVCVSNEPRGQVLFLSCRYFTASFGVTFQVASTFLLIHHSHLRGIWSHVLQWLSSITTGAGWSLLWDTREAMHLRWVKYTLNSSAIITWLTHWRLVPSILGLESMGNACYSKYHNIFNGLTIKAVLKWLTEPKPTVESQNRFSI